MKSKNSFTMNIKRTARQFLALLAIAASFTACKKDKNVEPTPPPPVEVVAISLQDLKALAKDEAVTVPDGRKISGIVISDAGGKNIAATSLILQEETGKPGIIVNLAEANAFKTGDKLEINISKQKLEKINGEVTLTGIPVANASKTGTGTITAKATNVEELTTNAAAWDGTLVSLGEGRFYGGSGKYATEGVEFADAKGRVKIGVASTATFKDQAYAASVSQLMAIVRVEGTKVRLDIRNATDVTGGEITKILTEDFTDISLIGNPHAYNPDIINAFTTDFGEWGVIEGLYVRGDRYDGSFLSSTRKYFYSVNSKSLGSIKYTNPNLKGLKKVSITFAGSKIEGDKAILKDPEYGGVYVSVPPFNIATDYFQVRLSGQVSQFGSFGLESPKITKTGEFTTVTFTIPSKEELLKINGVTPEDVDKFLANPQISFYNRSHREGFGNWDTVAPIVFDKIEFSFAN